MTLAVGRHTRVPRQYRGRDIFWWLDRLGALRQSVEEAHAIEISRHQPSLQLVGGRDRMSLDLATLHDRGVRLVGRVTAIAGSDISFADDLIGSTAAADIKMVEIQDRIDQFIAVNRLEAADPEPFRPTWPVATNAPERLDLRSERINTVIWATGYRRAYPWLHVNVLDRTGEIVHREGVTPVPGLYVLGMQFQRRRNSNLIDGVGGDAWVIAGHMARATRRVA